MKDNKKNKTPNKALSKNLSGLAFLVIGCLLMSSLFIESSSSSNFNREFKNYNINLQILNQDHKKLAEFKVQIADSQYKMAHGLMDLDSLPINYGMIFDFKKEQIATMWMKNTRIPLDMIFIDKDRHIVNIETAKPYSLEQIYSKAPVVNVLEINAGLAKKFGIKPQDEVIIN
jgi:uncharacterized membrane protein (UPF0127 family)